ncbi:hypothetical protein A2U01_0091355, partial [Trifolium medium]|nr:hypothetical protein [Trifolium medium]
ADNMLSAALGAFSSFTFCLLREAQVRFSFAWFVSGGCARRRRAALGTDT